MSSVTSHSSQSLSENPNYVLVDNVYYYTDTSTNKSYKHDTSSNEWIEVAGDDIPSALLSKQKDTESSVAEDQTTAVTVDEEGRKYYHSDGYYLCQDPTGQVYYMDHENSWQPWESLHKKKDEKWYFYRGNDRMYRDSKTRKVYKFNEELQEWKELEKQKKKRAVDDIEEYDSDDDDLFEYKEDAVVNSDIPLGFGSDPSITFDGTVYTKVDASDNIKYEWDTSKKAWFPKVDEDFMATYQLSYGFNPDGTKNENPLKFDDEEEIDEPMEEDGSKTNENKVEKKKPEWFEVDDQHNTKVYVSNLPNDLTEQEFVDLMQKCGLVLKDPETNNFKIKLYKDDNGQFKGDALCTYIRVESVDLALQILDGYNFKGKDISVERAKFTLKGSYDASKKPRKKRKRDLEKLQKQKEKLFDWRPEPMRGQRSKWENHVIVKNAFQPSEFDGHEARILEIQENLRMQCTAFGPVKKVQIFDRHPAGVLQVTFTEVEGADLCVTTLNNRLFNKRKIQVTTWDGQEKFNVEETPEEREKRLKKWDEYLQTS